MYHATEMIAWPLVFTGDTCSVTQNSSASKESIKIKEKPEIYPHIPLGNTLTAGKERAPASGNVCEFYIPPPAVSHETCRLERKIKAEKDHIHQPNP